MFDEEEPWCATPARGASDAFADGDILADGPVDVAVRLVTCHFGALGEDGRLEVSCTFLSGEQVPDLPRQSARYVRDFAYEVSMRVGCSIEDICFLNEEGDILFHHYLLADAAKGGPLQMVNKNRQVFKEEDALRPASCRRLEVLSAYLDDLLQMEDDLAARYNTDDRGLLLLPYSRPPDVPRLACSRRGARRKLDLQWEAWRCEVAKEEEAGVLEGAVWARFCLRAGEADAWNYALTLRQALQEGATLERSLSAEDCSRLREAVQSSMARLPQERAPVGPSKDEDDEAAELAFLNVVARRILLRAVAAEEV